MLFLIKFEFICRSKNCDNLAILPFITEYHFNAEMIKHYNTIYMMITNILKKQNVSGKKI